MALMQLIDETTADFTAMVQADFGPLPAGGLTHETLITWLHYRARCIVRRPRVVVQSAEVQALRTVYPSAISDISARLRVGADVSPWLSNTIRRQKSELLADPMFNDWQISHFHLGPISPLTGIVKRGKRNAKEPLLYAYIGADRAVLIDVQPHGAWTQAELLRILLRTDPQSMNTEAVGVLPSRTPFTDEERAVLRKKHVATIVEIEGRSFFAPGMGMGGNGGGVRFLILGDRIAHMVREVVQQIETNTLPQPLMQRVAGQIGLPVRLGIRFDHGEFLAYDKNRGLDLMRVPKILA